MANTENLIPLNQKCKESAKKIQSKGGKVRAKKAQERKSMREDLITLLGAKVDGKYAQEIGLAQMVSDWLKPETPTNERVQLFDRISKAIGEQGTEKIEADIKGSDTPPPIVLKVVDASVRE